MEFDASVKMVQQHHRCYPDGVKMYLVSEPEITKLEKTARECRSRSTDLELEKRFWILITIGACFLTSLASFFIGMMM